jgi:transcription antitermination factor NusG
MPILRAETELFPEDLLDDRDWEASGRQWMVLYTRARQEKAISRDLLRRAIPFYLPLVRQTRRYGRRRVASRTPLFSGYVFILATEAERVASLTTNRVSRILTVDDPQVLVHDLQQIHRLITSNAPLTVESRLSPGNRVRVRSGPFAGIEGTVLHRRGQARLLVSINFLQQGASVEIEDFLLEPID